MYIVTPPNFFNDYQLWRNEEIKNQLSTPTFVVDI